MRLAAAAMERFGLSWEAAWDGVPASVLIILTRQPAVVVPQFDPPDAPSDAEAEEAKKKLEELIKCRSPQI